MSRILRIAPLCAAVTCLASGMALASAENLHKQRHEDGKVCFSTHFHYKSSGAWPTKEQAVSTVKTAWSRFTGGEYGARWGNPDLAANASLSCSSAKEGRRESWSCSFSGRPCRPH